MEYKTLTQGLGGSPAGILPESQNDIATEQNGVLTGITPFPSDLSTANLSDGYAYCHPAMPPSCGQNEAVTQTATAMIDGKLTQQCAVTQRPVSARRWPCRGLLR